MRNIIDNSTVTASLRASGYIKYVDNSLLNLDISSLRIIVEAILLSDEILILDNYIEEHTKERKGIFDHKCINFQSIDEKQDKYILKHARAHISNWNLGKYLGTELADSFKDLHIMFKHAWRNSESFLVLKAFGIKDKYNSELSQAIHQMFNSSQVNELIKITKSKSYNKETKRFVQSISWMAIRTVYYRIASKIFKGTYLPHPLRNYYNTKCILFDNHPTTRKNKVHSSVLKGSDLSKKGKLEHSFHLHSLEHDYYQSINTFFENFWEECNSSDDNIFGVSTFDIEMPPFLGYVLNKTNNSFNSKHLFEEVFKIREQPEIIELRKVLNTIIDEDNEIERGKRIRNFAVELRDLKRYMQNYLGYDREKVKISAKLISYNMIVPRVLLKPYYPHKKHLSFVRDVILECASAGTLGYQIDKLLHGRRWY